MWILEVLVGFEPTMITCFAGMPLRPLGHSTMILFVLSVHVHVVIVFDLVHVVDHFEFNI